MDPQALEDLAASIAQHGVLTPILFRQGVMVSLSGEFVEPENTWQ
jgi:ParB-like chromosome segregation protein Spo0J